MEKIDERSGSEAANSVKAPEAVAAGNAEAETVIDKRREFTGNVRTGTRGAAVAEWEFIP